IIAKVGTVAYRLELPEKLIRVYSTFHVLNLKKCLADEPLAIPLDEIQVDDKLHFIEEPVEIMDREVKRLKQSRIPIVKISRNVTPPDTYSVQGPFGGVTNTESKLGDDGDPISDPTLYWSLADHGLQLFSSSTTSLVAYLDADWAGCPATRISTSGYCVFLATNLLSWSSKRQLMLSRSSDEAEYHGVANVVAETCWFRNLLHELHTHLSFATLVYCDNVSAIYLAANPVKHQLSHPN
ncbi:ribonuclease H-like domain-containing protein, partial [Tanacetum coccineum]